MRFLAESGFLLLLRYDNLLCDLVGIWQRHWAGQYCNNVSSIAKAAFKTLWCFEALKFSTGIGWDNIHHLHKDQCTWHLWPSINTKSLGELNLTWVFWHNKFHLHLKLFQFVHPMIFQPQPRCPTYEWYIYNNLWFDFLLNGLNLFTINVPNAIYVVFSKFKTSDFTKNEVDTMATRQRWLSAAWRIA